jgi:hypothetical protein
MRIPPFIVRLTSSDRGKPVEFSAYAFNDDRVMSAIVTDDTYSVPVEIPPRPRRAYVIAMGVNAYQNSHRNLAGAVADAQAVVASLSSIKGYQVVPIVLLSDTGADGEGFSVNTGTKDNLRSVLSLLVPGARASLSTTQWQALRASLGHSIDQLEQATPDDLVILYFSGHGYAAPDGRFYILASDSGTHDDIGADDFPKLISAAELTDWLRRVDAGNTVMILDTCHAARITSSGAKEFKAAPLGNSGLGQLAYDKGMRVLAATQADNIALESDVLGGGLLTYALVHEGLQHHQADTDGDGKVTLAEWLQYAVGRVPTLYQYAREGRLKLVSRGQVITAERLKTTVSEDQTPQLFDFHIGSGEIILQ